MKPLFLCLCFFVCCYSGAFGSDPEADIAPPENSKLLTDWIGLQLKFIRTTKGITQGHVTKQFSLISIAFYECLVSGDRRYRSLAGQLQQLEKTAPAPAQVVPAASANAAYAMMLRAFFGNDPVNKKMIDSLESVYASGFVKDGSSESQVQAATQYGKSVASSILEWAKGDGSATQYPPYEIPKGLGKWEPTAPGFVPPAAPQLIHFRSCVKGSSDNTLPPAPVEFSSEPTSPFYKMVKEVYDVAEKLTPEQKAIALFWDDYPDGRYYGAIGHWSSILSQVILANKIELMKGSEAFVKMTIATSDAQLACWKGKYTYNVLRPITYITKYMQRPEWKSLIITPNHPEYPAAHATVSMAAATALTDALGKSVSFTDHTYDDIGFKPRTFASFEQAAKEAGMSRLYGGIHYKPSIDAGYSLGNKTASLVLGGLDFKSK